MKKLLLPVLIFCIMLASNAFASIDVLNASVSVSGNPAQTVAGSFVVANNGNTTESVSFSNYQLTHSNGLYSVNVNNINSVSIAPSTTQTVGFSIAVPSGQYAGVYSGTLLVQGSNQDSVAVSLNVNSVENFAISLVSGTWVKGIDSAKNYDVVVNNTGNSDISSISFTISDLTLGSFLIPKSLFNVPSVTNLQFGESRTVSLGLSGVSATQTAGSYSGTLRGTSPNRNVSTSVSLNVRTSATDMTVSPSPVLLGSSSQIRKQTISTGFTITNNGDTAITGITVSTNTPSTYQISFSNAPTSLAPGQSTTVTISAYVPESQASSIAKIGDIVINSDQLTRTVQLNMQTKGALLIDKVSATATSTGGGEDSASVHNNGDTLSLDVAPGDSVKMDITFKNDFSSSESIDINEVDTTITIEGIDDGDDIEEDLSTFDVRAGKKVTKSITFTVPLNTDEDEYPVDISAEGSDDNDVTQSADWTVYLRVRKKDHDLRISNAQLTPDTVTCERNVNIQFKVTNYGSNEEDAVSLWINSPLLGIDIREWNIDLSNDLSSSDSSVTKLYQINLPANLTTGSYSIPLNVYADSNVENFWAFLLKVNPCQPGGTPSTPSTPVVVPPVYTPGETTTTTGSGISNSTIYLALLIGLNLILLIAIVALVARAFGSR